MGRYVLAQRLTSDYTNLGNPVNAMANLVTRSWNDRGGWASTATTFRNATSRSRRPTASAAR